MKFKKAIPYEIVISASANGGFIVRVGCATLVYTSSAELMTDLKDYLADPKTVEKKYNESGCSTGVIDLPDAERPRNRYMPESGECAPTTQI